MNCFKSSLNHLDADVYPTEAINAILQTAIRAADPFQVVFDNIEVQSSQLIVGEVTYPLYPHTRIVMVSIGKASPSMAAAAVERLGEHLSRGVVVCKHPPEKPIRHEAVEVLIGSHPVPDQRSVDAGKVIHHAVPDLHKDDLVLFLVSGGGSSLVCLPAPGITLWDIQAVTSDLLKSGASINEMNAVRKHLDLFKGGGFLKMTSPARVAALVISDVVNSPLDVIASGPAVPDTSTFADAQQILQKYIDQPRIPETVKDFIHRGCAGKIEDTLKPTDPDTSRAVHTIVASNCVSAEAALSKALNLGFNAEILTLEMTGEARKEGAKLAALLATKAQQQRPYLGIAGGETTVKVTGNGLGGRNLEVALGAVQKMHDLKRALLITLATDGEDGPTNAAGACVSAETSSCAKTHRLDECECLHNNDAYHYFEKVGGLLLTGPSGTNVNDLSFIFQF
jgi:hydroxypyruvate reductase